MISAVGSPIGESDAVLAVASAQLVFASKVWLTRLCLSHEHGWLRADPILQKICQRPLQDDGRDADGIRLLSLGVCHFGRGAARGPVVTPVSTGGPSRIFQSWIRSSRVKGQPCTNP